MKAGAGYRAEDFDENGLLKAPVVFWCALFLQLRTWWLTGMVILTGQGSGWVALFYPDAGWQVPGLVGGVPALAMLFCYPVRAEMPFLARAAYLLMLAGVLLMAGCDVAVMAGAAGERHELVWLLLCADLACLTGLWPDRRLREIFFG
ncbi:TPA: DUF2919 family protein [Salmonella enterica subsp. salamae serovar 9,46:z4,z24:z39:z42]|nr:DUF2919 family protein [Salmonella enterica subsp. salamae serovar 9,46:z4,z24:z39:z42]